MTFNSFTFMIFLPIVFALYWFACRGLRSRNALLLVASYVFYGWWDTRFLGLIILTSASSYISALLISRYRDMHTAAKAISAANIILNLGILATFKYYNFFVQSLSAMLTAIGWNVDFPTMSIILPVGISFYTFQALSYTIDVYRRKIEPTTDAIAFFTFIAFFPQLVAGPIERASSLLPQMLRNRYFSYPHAVDGLRQMLWGFFKKLVIADICAATVNAVWAVYEQASWLSLVAATILFSFQIYADFSGYSDIAIGCARLFGINLSTNFATPYFSRDVREFWQRWHITLMTWFREYVYFPLGGSRHGKARTITNVLIVFLLSGLWHGANITFILWGLWHALLFIILILLSVPKKTGTPAWTDAAHILLTFVLVNAGWIIFRAPDVTSLTGFTARLLSPAQAWIPVMEGISALMWCALLIVVEWVQRRQPHALCIDRFRLMRHSTCRLTLYALIAGIIFIFAGKVQTFIYFQF